MKTINDKDFPSITINLRDKDFLDDLFAILDPVVSPLLEVTTVQMDGFITGKSPHTEKTLNIQRKIINILRKHRILTEYVTYKPEDNK